MEDGFPTVSIIGVGLVGGSFALALKEKGLAKKITRLWKKSSET